MKKGVQSVLFSVLVGALLLCAGCGKSGDIYTAGVYTASAEGYSGPVTVEVEFDGSSILSVHVLSHSETVNTVSYTHLDVYKRQSQYRGERQAGTSAGNTACSEKGRNVCHP